MTIMPVGATLAVALTLAVAHSPLRSPSPCGRRLHWWVRAGASSAPTGIYQIARRVPRIVMKSWWRRRIHILTVYYTH